MSDTLDPDFLSALPEDVRQEVLDEHRRNQLAKKSTLFLTTANVSKRRKPVIEAPMPGGRRLRLPPHPPKPTFTTMNLSTLSELRETLKDWFREFKSDGPNIEDVGALERYLRRVVVDERDLSKVVGVIRWLAWLIDDVDDQEDLYSPTGYGQKEKGKRAWEEALKGVKDRIQEAVKERGLGRLEL